MIECNASVSGESTSSLLARHEVYPESLHHLHVPSSYTIADSDLSGAGGGCSLSLTSDTLSLLTYVASSLQSAGRGNFIDNGFLLRPGVPQSLMFQPTNATEAIDCHELSESLQVYSANNPAAVRPHTI